MKKSLEIRENDVQLLKKYGDITRHWDVTNISGEDVKKLLIISSNIILKYYNFLKLSEDKK